jgi:hypothetical protein
MEPACHRQLNIDDLTLNEFRSLISNKIKDQFMENMKLIELFKLLPTIYEYQEHWCDDLSIAEVKSLLWMDDYELYPLKMKEIKIVLSKLTKKKQTWKLLFLFFFLRRAKTNYRQTKNKKFR